MNQRVKRSSDKKQNLNAISMNTGGHIVAHERNKEPVIMTPKKATGDVKPEELKGAAKASPLFKKLEDKAVEPETKEVEAKTIAKNTIKKEK